MNESAGHPLEDLLDEAIEASHGGKISLADLLEHYGTRSFGPILVILSLVIISPIGGIPVLPIIVGGVIMLLSAQIVIGHKHIWLPARMRNAAIDREKAKKWRANAHRTLARIDRLIQSRLHWATAKTAQWLAAICLIFLSLTMIPLELVPFGVTAPGIAILCFGAGLTARDGLLMLLGFLITVPSLWVTIAWWPWG